ncbi:MAG: hypothetical protein M3Y50_17425 [Acidobacteriota bacterium]|nr:hypothetical protein [Acidobacteriota bacterium]
MWNVSRSSCVRSIFVFLLAAVGGSSGRAQITSNPTLDRQLSRIDLGILGSGALNKDSHGTAIVNGQPTQVNLHSGNTVGPLITVRYIKSPLLGVEFNYGYARYTDTFTPYGAQPTVGVQQNAAEYTLGYVAHFPRPVFGVNPFVAVGAGTMDFRPTSGGGNQLLPQARATYYYSIGAEANVLSPHFGLRAQFRQAFFKAPDFETNFLTIQQHTSTLEPGIGFFLRF